MITHPKQSHVSCMANALHTLNAQKELPTAKWIVINSDCLHFFQRIGRKSEDVVGKKIANILRKIRLRASTRKGLIMPKFEFRHVKAHNGTPDARSFVNDWCDKEAKKWKNKAIEEKVNQTLSDYEHKNN